MHSFTPFWGVAFPDWQNAEKAFFQSLKNLCDCKGWTAPETSGLPFPQNVSAVMKVIPLNAGEGENIMLLNDREHPLSLATVTTFNTNYRLYYIPVRPLYKMSQIPEMSAHCALVKGLFAYLYNVAGVPYFREPGYLDNTYDTLENWIGESDDEDDNEFRERQKDEMEAMRFGGDYLLPLIQEPCDLAQLRKLIAAFSPADKYEDNLQEVAVEIWKLYHDYPIRKIKDNMHYEFAESEDSDQIYWENYISFYWSGEDCLQENIFDMVNSELQELGCQEEPVAIQWFDTPQEKVTYDFDFEARFFALLNRLTELLNDFDYEEPDK